MKKYSLIGLAIGIAVGAILFLYGLAPIHAAPRQIVVAGSTVTVISVPSTATLGTCNSAAPPTAGTTLYCYAGNGTVYTSLNGAAYTTQPGSGVASVTVCNAAGASCGAAQTGPVTLSIPKTAVVTVAAPAATATLN